MHQWQTKAVVKLLVDLTEVDARSKEYQNSATNHAFPVSRREKSQTGASMKNLQ
jgi:hypothetical protein